MLVSKYLLNFDGFLFPAADNSPHKMHGDWHNLCLSSLQALASIVLLLDDEAMSRNLTTLASVQSGFCFYQITILFKMN